MLNEIAWQAQQQNKFRGTISLYNPGKMVAMTNNSSFAFTSVFYNISQVIRTMFHAAESADLWIKSVSIVWFLRKNNKITMLTCDQVLSFLRWARAITRKAGESLSLCWARSRQFIQFFHSFSHSSSHFLHFLPQNTYQLRYICLRGICSSPSGTF